MKRYTITLSQLKNNIDSLTILERSSRKNEALREMFVGRRFTFGIVWSPLRSLTSMKSSRPKVKKNADTPRERFVSDNELPKNRGIRITVVEVRAVNPFLISQFVLQNLV